LTNPSVARAACFGGELHAPNVVSIATANQRKESE
jgi:hypothetical protein